MFFGYKVREIEGNKNKIIAGIFVSTVIYWIGVGILSLISFAVMGTSGFSHRIRLMIHIVFML